MQVMELMPEKSRPSNLPPQFLDVTATLFERCMREYSALRCARSMQTRSRRRLKPRRKAPESPPPRAGVGGVLLERPATSERPRICLLGLATANYLIILYISILNRKVLVSTNSLLAATMQIIIMATITLIIVIVILILLLVMDGAMKTSVARTPLPYVPVDKGTYRDMNAGYLRDEGLHFSDLWSHFFYALITRELT